MQGEIWHRSAPNPWRSPPAPSPQNPFLTPPSFAPERSPLSLAPASRTGPSRAVMDGRSAAQPGQHLGERTAADRALSVASLSLVSFGLLTTLALVAWFVRVADPWTYKGALAILSAVGSFAAAGLILARRRRELRFELPHSRGPVVFGALVMAASIARVGLPSEWTGASAALVAITLLFLVPVVQALIAVSRSRP